MNSFWCLSLLLMSWSLTNGQFLYNYEDNQSEEQPEDEESLLYKYNSPSAVQQYYPESLRSPPVAEKPAPIRPRANDVPQSARYEPRTPRRYYEEEETEVLDDEAQPEPNYEPEYAPDVPTNYQRRRTSRRRQSRMRYRAREPVTEPPRVYGPSVFENIGLGVAPDGIYVPEDSLLNKLRSDVPRQTRPANYAPQHNNVVGNSQPSVQPERNHQSDISPFLGETPSQQYQAPVSSRPSYQSNVVPQRDPEPGFFVEPPRNEPTRQRPQPVYHQPSNQEIPQNEYPRPRRVSQQPREVQQPQTPRRHRQQPVVSFRETASQPERREVPVRSSYNIDNNQDYLDDRRRSSVQNFEEVPRKRQRLQEPVTQAPANRARATFKPANLAIAELPDDTDGDGIPGEAGVDYPTLHSIPTTSFSCSQQPHNGYYADLETSCQVMHLCQSGGNKDSFLCPNGTIFSQDKFSCQWWYKVNCQNSPRYYSFNDRLYKVPNENNEKK